MYKIAAAQRRCRGLSGGRSGEESPLLSAIYRDVDREFPKLKDITLKPTLTLLLNNTSLEVKPMKRLISCEYNFDNCCVELKFTDGSMIALDTTAGAVLCGRK